MSNSGKTFWDVTRFVLPLSLLFLFFVSALFPQNPNSIKVGAFLAEAGENNALHIFYRTEWLHEAGIDSVSPELSLDEFVAKIQDHQQLAVIERQGLIVILPAEGVGDGKVITDENRIYIGNPADLGRFTRAQIQGVVYDGQTSVPLPGATLSFADADFTATTDREGRFSVQLPTGEIEVTVSFIGFQDLRRELFVFSGGEIELELFDDFVQLEGVTVRGHRMRDNVRGTRMSIISMDAQSVKELPVSFGESDIIRSFTLKPGVQSVGEFGSGFNVRGGSTDQNLILLEGVPLFNSSHLFGLTSVVNSDMISRVDLLKAGIPARFGERVSSVMDIRMSQEEVPEPRISGGVGLLISRLQLQTPLFNDKLSVSFSGRSSYSNWFLENMPDNDLMNSEADFYDLSGVITFRPMPNQLFSVFGYQSEDNFLLASNSSFRYKSELASLQWSGFLSQNVRSHVLLGYSDYRYRIRDHLTSNRGNSYQLSSGIQYLTARWNTNWYPNTSHSLEAGVNAVHYTVSPGNMTPYGEESLLQKNALADEQAAEFAIYISDIITFSPRMELEAGLRYSFYRQLGPGTVFQYDYDLAPGIPNITDTLTFTDNETIVNYGGLEPRISFRYGIDEESSLKISYNRINQYINQLSNTSVANPSDIWKLSDRHLKPLTSDQIAMGYFRNFPGQSLEVSAEMYFKQLHNIVEYKNGANLLMNEIIETDLINASGYSYGAELSLEKHEGRLNGWMSYAFNLSRVRSDEQFAASMINRNTYFPSNHEQPHNVGVNANYRISRRWRFNTTFVYATGRPVTLPELVYQYDDAQVIYFSDRNAYRMPDYHRLDLAITFGENLKKNRSWKGSWTFSLVNVYGRKNAYSIFYQKEKPHAGNDFRNYSLYKMYIIGIPLPTITYNFSF